MKFKIAIIGVALCFCTKGKSSAIAPSPEALQAQLTATEQTIPFPYHNALLTANIEDNNEAFFFYESLFEQELADRQLPKELKHLPSALTATNITYNKNNRCGVWALPVFVALRYGLVVTAQHDERFDVQLATRAALRYIADLYKMYGNWWATILAYANSPTALNSANIRHENNLQPWDYFDKNLLENVNVIPNFIALNLQHSTQPHTATNVQPTYSKVELKRPILRSLLSRKIDLRSEIIAQLNPIFRGETIVPLNNHKLCLPEENAVLFRNFEDTIYAETAAILKLKAQQKKAESTPKTKIYIVRSGDSVGKIAQQFGVGIASLKKWNNLRSDNIYIGQRLTIVEPKSEPKSAVSQPSQTQAPTSNKIIHRVRRGDSLGKIAEKYHIRVSDIKRWNNLQSDMIREDQRLIIYKK